jgi:hypothetical protein
MTMARGVSEIDRLIEEGLSLYGEGDLDGALLLWDRVLVMDPENPQANSYVDYVRMNYELLTSDQDAGGGGPFAIASDDPEHQLEIAPVEDGTLPPPAPLLMAEHAHGWGIGEDRDSLPALPGALTLDLDPEDLPPGGDPATFETKTGEEVSFEAATREYQGAAGRPTSAQLGQDPPTFDPEFDPEFAPEITPTFGGAEDFQTPPDFGSQITDVRRRDLGFVHLTDAERRADPRPPERKISLRTPSSASAPALATPRVEPAPPRTTTAARAALDLQSPPSSAGRELTSAYASLDLELELELSSVPEQKVADDLVARADTLPAVPDGRKTVAAELVAPSPLPRPPAASTRPMPASPPPPFDPGAAGAPAEPDEVAAPTALTALILDERRATWDMAHELTESSLEMTAPTLDMPYVMKLDPRLAVHPDPQLAAAAPKNVTGTSAAQLPPRPPLRSDDSSLITAPTRDLGLRELALRPERRAATEDETTGQVDVFRVRGNGKPEIPGMDPIDARSAEILEQIDRGAPAIETREERTRRRITVLLDRAVAWNRDGDLDRAVTAVDLALSEDPNSALAQKLIHRNRETIMNAFQAFVGDLQRTPSLARPLHELASAPISPRAAFLLSRVDGTLSLDEILDVSGMPRLEAYRYLCQLLLRGILR